MVSIEAEELNVPLKNTIASRLFSNLGRNSFYPKKGIPGQSMEAKGTKINATLGQAYDDDGKPLTLDCFIKYAHQLPKESFLYPPSHGLKELRELWREEIKRKNFPYLEGTTISLPVVTNGLSNALTLTQQLFINEGDTVIIQAPYWGNYKLHMQGENGKTTLNEIPLYRDGRFNFESIEEAMTGSGKKYILSLTLPSNPTGFTPSLEETRNLIEIIQSSAKRDNDILVITDDAYFGLNYEEELPNQSLFAHFANLHENILAVKVDGATKECFFWGGRVGFITFGYKGMTSEAAKALEDKVAGRVRGTISGIATTSQQIVLQGIQDPEFIQQVENNRDILRGRYQTIKEHLSQHPEYEEEFTPLPFNSGYFMCLKLLKDTEKVRTILRTEMSTGVLAIGYKLRIAHSGVPKHHIPELYDNIYKACKMA